jgi:hypothetical protein
LAKLNTSVYNSDNFKFSNALELQKCFNEIITYIKSLSNDKDDQDDLRNKLSLKYKGAVINDGSDEDDYRNKMSLNLVGYKF